MVGPETCVGFFVYGLRGSFLSVETWRVSPPVTHCHAWWVNMVMPDSHTGLQCSGSHPVRQHHRGQERATRLRPTASIYWERQ